MSHETELKLLIATKRQQNSFHFYSSREKQRSPYFSSHDVLNQMSLHFFLSFDDDGDDAAAADDETEETDFSTRFISSQEAKMFKSEQRCGIVHMSKHLPRSSAADNGGVPRLER